MNKPPANPTQAYRTLLAGYNDAIRQSDFKANIALLFVMFMMGTVVWNYQGFPPYLPVQLVLLPFLFVYLCMFLVIIPRFPRRGAKNFLVARNLTAADFDFVGESEDDINQLKLRCAIFSDILWWKTFYIRIGFFVSIACVFLTLFLLFYAWVR